MFNWKELFKKNKEEVSDELKNIENLKKQYEENMKLFKRSIQRIEEAS